MLHLLISGSKGSSHNGWEVACSKPSEIVHMGKMSQEGQEGVAGL